MLDSIGNSSSTVSLSIMQRTSGAVIQNSCIAFVDIVLATLLARCVDDERTFDITNK